MREKEGEMIKAVPYILVNRVSHQVYLRTSKRGVAKVMGVTYDCLRKRGFKWADRDDYGDWVIWSGIEVLRQRKGFGLI